MRLAIASLFTLALLAGMLFSILLALSYVVGFINIYVLLGLTIGINFVMWLIGPKISDFIYRVFYKVRWISISELRDKSPKAAKTIEKICNKYKFRIPKLGIIPDKNPNAFTYGSGRWNARIIVTEGIFEYLDENEISAVYAHELGHIKNRDFIVMTVASVILQLLYELFVISRSVSKEGARTKKGERADIYIILIGIISYVFYLVGQYILLYLSRVREYYADEFSAKNTDPNHLSSALIKIAYGILANPDNVRLIESTKFIGIMNFKSAKSIGMVYYNCERLNDFKPLVKALLFDIYNPWAYISELSSTHPLTGKRIRRLCSLSKKPLFDFGSFETKYKINKQVLYKNFIKDLAVLSFPFIATFIYIPIVGYLVYGGRLSFSLGILGGFFLLLGFSTLILTLYKYPSCKEKPSSILELMSDLYASPVRGKCVSLNGKIVGRGIPGLIFSEDMLFEDSTGLIYINYESWLPILGNLLFGIRKVRHLIGREAEVKG